MDFHGCKGSRGVSRECYPEVKLDPGKESKAKRSPAEVSCSGPRVHERVHTRDCVSTVAHAPLFRLEISVTKKSFSRLTTYMIKLGAESKQ